MTRFIAIHSALIKSAGGGLFPLVLSVWEHSLDLCLCDTAYNVITKLCNKPTKPWD